MYIIRYLDQCSFIVLSIDHSDDAEVFARGDDGVGNVHAGNMVAHQLSRIVPQQRKSSVERLL